MARFDLDPELLAVYLPEVREPEDFDSFWSETIAEARAAGSDPVLVPAATPLTAVDVFDVTFSGFGGEPVKAWLSLPRGADEPLPVVVEYNGYGGGRGLPHERQSWSLAGYAHLFMDTRGQGATWGSGGETPDPHGSGPAGAGFMTRGIRSPHEYYYRRLFTDAVRAVDAVRTIERIDPARVAITGGSQGGGITLAVAGLTGGLVAVMPDVPFLCHFERAVGLTDADPYGEIQRYLAVQRGAAATVFETLSYFDGVNFARRADAPGLFSVGLVDPICPPSTVYAAYNHYGADKQIAVYPHNQHEGGGGYQWIVQTEFLARQLGRA